MLRTSVPATTPAPAATPAPRATECRATRLGAVVVVCSLAASGGGSQSAWAQNWINFVNETSTRLIADSGLVLTDPQEKDYGYGDFDQDGDVDLVIVRKTPFSVPGRQRNVLLMNEGIAQGHAIDGVLVDRTTEYGTAATDGGQGLKDLTDDRDVIVVDGNNDGWLDIVTATTYGSGLAKSISHPRVYINLGEIAGVWQGFRYEENRFPNLGSHPNFCGVGAGDVTGDKFADLYFVDYDRTPNSSYDDKLLINDGNGFFSDQTATRVSSTFSTSSFGTTATIADMNGDGHLDIVKSENGPVKTAYNNGAGSFLTSIQSTYNGAAYFSSVGDLNGDGRLDILISDDSTDRYLLNQNTSGGGQSTFANLSFPNSGGFGSVSRTVDMNNDGFNDVIICDVDVDASGCDRTTKIFRNLGNLPNVTMTNPGQGGLTSAMLQGTYDVAVIDLDMDGWKDLVVGRCNSTQIWRQVPPSGLLFAYPQGIPAFLPSDEVLDFQVQVTAVSGTPAPGTGVLHYSINNAPFVDVPMSDLGGDLYQAQLPAVACTDIIRFYVTAELTGGGTFSDPPGGAAAPYQAVAADGEEITLMERFEAPALTWTVQNHASLTQGAWDQGDPNGTSNFGAFAAPEDDAGANEDVMCFVTENGPVGGAANANDVDGGPTYLLSPTIDLDGTDATISYQRWFYSLPANDFLKTEVSNNNGSTWVFVHQTASTNSAWEAADFRVGQFVTPTAQVRVRFSVTDSPNDSVTEAGIDNFIIQELVCGVEPCPADIAGGDGNVNIDDLLVVINAWGATSGPADVNQSGLVDIDDLLAVINGWGACP
jgi:hypothetical protein